MSDIANELNKLLTEVLEKTADESLDLSALKSGKRKKLRENIETVIKTLDAFGRKLDSAAHPAHIFDPADPQAMGRMIAETLLIQDRTSLEQTIKAPFYGSGIYALYYKGKFPAYAPLVRSETPIYVGKADPENHDAKNPKEQGTRLFTRLKDHAKSIGCVDNLRLSDFDCRYLVVVSAWQNTAETYLIHRFLPVWDKDVGPCKGIGKHGDSASTRSNTRSPWDTLHKGRPWAWTKGNKSNPKSPEQICKDIAEHFKEHPPERG